MSFFKDMKDELAQAVNDIEAEDGTGKNPAEDLFSVAEETKETDTADSVEDSVDKELVDSLFEDDSMVEKEEKPEEQKPAPTPVKEERPARELSEEDREAVTVITKGTTINGSIISDCSLDVMGTINGDIECLGKLTISGKVTGNSLASEVYVTTDRLEGSITSEGSVKVGLGTVIVGDIVGNSAVIAGAVKGEIDVKGPVVIDSTAIIKGNVKAKSIQMNNGAVLEGFCSLAYASLEIDNIFE